VQYVDTVADTQQLRVAHVHAVAGAAVYRCRQGDENLARMNWLSWN